MTRINHITPNPSVKEVTQGLVSLGYFARARGGMGWFT
jgi:hypothetical protein